MKNILEEGRNMEVQLDQLGRVYKNRGNGNLPQTPLPPGLVFQTTLLRKISHHGFCCNVLGLMASTATFKFGLQISKSHRPTKRAFFCYLSLYTAHLLFMVSTLHKVYKSLTFLS